MDALLWVRAMCAIATLAAVLFALQYILRTIQRGGRFGLDRLVEVLESTPLAHASALHLVRVGDKHYIVGGSQAQASLICEVPPESIETWRRSRVTMGRSAGLKALVARFRRQPPACGPL